MQPELIEIWGRVLSLLKSELSEISYNTWIKTIEPLSWDLDAISFLVPSNFNKGILYARYNELIIKSIFNVTSKKYSLNFLTGNEIESIERKPKNDILQTWIPLNKGYTFDNFIVGNCNKFAYCAALEQAKSTSRIYNPLFIYSSHGLGKTHLLQAIGNYISNNVAAPKILYITIEKFVNDLISAIKIDQRDEFIQRFTLLDVLLVDDIQFICQKERTQEELFHILRDLSMEGKQVVIAGTKAPRDIEYIDGNFSSIFDIGLVVEIVAPEIETKYSFLWKYCLDTNIDFSEEIIKFIAGKAENIRELKVCINKLIAYSAVMEKPINIEIVSEVLR